MLLVLFLKDTFQLFHLVDIEVQNKISLHGDVFYLDSFSDENEGFIGFYDWLRTDETSIVGIRIAFFENQNYSSFFNKLPYLNITKYGVELLFGKEDKYDFDLSGDQDFTNNYVYSSEKGDSLITFGLDHLDKKEILSLLQFCKEI